MDPNLTKDQILHPLIDAERRGVFNNPPESPYHWEMAQRDPDMPVEPLKNKMPEPRKERSKGGDVPIHFKTLQSTCKSLHINCVGMTKQEMHDAILKVLNEGQGEVRPEGEGESLEGENREVGRPFGALVEKGSIKIEGED